MKTLKINNDHCLIIAEVGINHNGSLERALQMIDEAAEAGVDVVKFQNISEETTFNFSDKSDPIYDFVKKYSLQKNDYKVLKKRCENKGVTFLSSAADVPAARFLNSIGVSGFKVSSGNFNNFHLLSELIKYKLPLILSTGMSNEDEIIKVVEFFKKNNFKTYSLLYCVSEYPASFESLDFSKMDYLKNNFNAPIGFSDHTNGIISSLVARNLGATIIEKHFTLDRNLEGPDHSFSLLPEDFERLVFGIRSIEKILFSDKRNKESLNKQKLRRCMYYNKKMNKGDTINFDDIAAKRPYKAEGISPEEFQMVIGKKLKNKVDLNELIKIEHLA